MKERSVISVSGNLGMITEICLLNILYKPQVGPWRPPKTVIEVEVEEDWMQYNSELITGLINTTSLKTVVVIKTY